MSAHFITRTRAVKDELRCKLAGRSAFFFFFFFASRFQWGIGHRESIWKKAKSTKQVERIWNLWAHVWLMLAKTFTNKKKTKKTKKQIHSVVQEPGIVMWPQWNEMQRRPRRLEPEHNSPWQHATWFTDIRGLIPSPEHGDCEKAKLLLVMRETEKLKDDVKSWRTSSAQYIQCFCFGGVFIFFYFFFFLRTESQPEMRGVWLWTWRPCCLTPYTGNQLGWHCIRINVPVTPKHNHDKISVAHINNRHTDPTHTHANTQPFLLLLLLTPPPLALPPTPPPPRTQSGESVGKLFLGPKQRAFLSLMLLLRINIPPLNQSDRWAVCARDGNFLKLTPSES